MWDLHQPDPIKLITGTLACDEQAMALAREAMIEEFGPIDLESDVWPFNATSYYVAETGPAILRQFASFQRLVGPGDMARIKLATNSIEKLVAGRHDRSFSRPVNIDPGILEPGKLVLASTKNYSHRVYIGGNIYAEVTLVYERGQWRPMPHTYPDYRQQCYMDFFTRVRVRLMEQLRSER